MLFYYFFVSKLSEQFLHQCLKIFFFSSIKLFGYLFVDSCIIYIMHYTNHLKKHRYMHTMGMIGFCEIEE